MNEYPPSNPPQDDDEEKDEKPIKNISRRKFLMPWKKEGGVGQESDRVLEKQDKPTDTWQDNFMTRLGSNTFMNERKASRRDFMKGAAVFSSIFLVPKALSSLKEIMEMPRTEEEKRAVQFINGLNELSEGLPKHDDRSNSEQDQIHDQVSKRVDKEIGEVVTGTNLDDPRAIEVLLISLSDFSCQGKVYKALSEQGKYQDFWKKRKVDIFSNKLDKVDNYLPSKIHYSTRVADFLPTGKEIFPEEIDPRLAEDIAEAGKKGQYNELSIATNAAIEKNPAWASDNKQKEFKRLLDDSAIREKLQNEPGLTLAESYSLIKAVLDYEEGHQESLLTHELVLEKLLEERRKFAKKEILGPKTDKFIVFNYEADNNFSLEDVNNIAKISGAEEEKMKAVRGNEKGAKESMLNAISESSGETTIWFNTHGSEIGLYVTKDEYINDSELTVALLDRLEKADDPKDLAKMTLIADSCNSYDMARNILWSLRFEYSMVMKYPGKEEGELIPLAEKMGVPFEELPLPNIISAAQKGSFGFSGNFERPLLRMAKAIKKDNALNGDMFLRRVQPEMYGSADPTFFTSKKGDAVELGNNEKNMADRAIA